MEIKYQQSEFIVRTPYMQDSQISVQYIVTTKKKKKQLFFILSVIVAI